MKHFLFATFFLLYTQVSGGQNPELDSIKNPARLKYYRTMPRNKIEDVLAYAQSILDTLNSSKPVSPAYIAFWQGYIGNIYTHDPKNNGYKKAIKQFEKPLEYLVAINKPDFSYSIGSFFLNRGYSYAKTNWPKLAVKDWEKALSYFQADSVLSFESRIAISIIFSNISAVTHENGDYQKGVEFCANAIGILESKKVPFDNMIYIIPWINIGQCYRSLGEFELSKLYLDRALDLSKKLNYNFEPSQVATIYDGLGQYYLDNSKPDSALLFIEEGYRILIKKSPSSKYLLSFLKFKTGLAYREKGQLLEAENRIQLAIMGYKQSVEQSPAAISEYYREWGVTLQMRDLWDEGLVKMDSAEMMLTDTSNASKELIFRYAINVGRADIYLSKYLKGGKQTADINNAEHYLKISQSWLDKRHQNITDFDPIFLRNVQNQTRVAQAVLIEKAEVADAQSCHESMFESADRGKSLELFERFMYLSAFDLYNKKLVPEAKINKLKNLYVEVGDLEAKLGQLNKDSKEGIKMIKILGERHTLIDNLEAEMRASDPAFAKKRTQKPGITVKEIQDSLEPDQCLVEYVVADSVIYIHVIQKSKPITVVSIKKDPRFDNWLDTISNICQKQITRFSEDGITKNKGSSRTDEVLDQSSVFSRAAFGLYNQLIRPISTSLTSRPMIIRDGRMNNLPFEVLIDSMPAHKVFYDSLPFLLYKYKFSYEHSASVFFEMHNNLIKRKKSGVLYYAPFSDKSIDSYPMLELSKYPIENMCKNIDCRKLYGKDADINTFIEEADKYKIIHLYTHGKPDYQNGNKSMILFRKNSNSADSLFAAQIYAMNLGAELVTLSACQTSEGQLRNGEGIVGISAAFASAGARSIIGTQWEANTNIAANPIFNNFYSGLERLNRDEALQKAKIKYIEDQRDLGHEAYSTQPYYWAPFILIGEPGLIKF